MTSVALGRGDGTFVGVQVGTGVNVAVGVGASATRASCPRICCATKNIPTQYTHTTITPNAAMMSH
jgi:hypothetical protein